MAQIGPFQTDPCWHEREDSAKQATILQEQAGGCFDYQHLKCKYSDSISQLDHLSNALYLSVMQPHRS